MSEEEKKKEDTGQLSRREFLKDAGLIVGGATVGSMALLAACEGGTTATVTETKTATTTATVGAGATVTVSKAAETVTVTAPGGTTVKTVTAGATGALTLKVNGQSYSVKAEPEWSLSFVLRHVIGLTGTKVGCDRGECGSCTIIVGGKAVLACCIMAVEAEGLDITTIEGLAKGPTLSKVQQAFLDTQAFQCGYCTPGQIMMATALLAKTPKPTRAQVREAMSGNLCFCGDYTRIEQAILKGAA